MAIDAGPHSYTSTARLMRDARWLLTRIVECADRSLLAQFLLRIRLVPLGRPGILALGRVRLPDLEHAETLYLVSKTKRVALPNVFLGLPLGAARDFLRTASSPSFLRESLLGFGFSGGKHFDISHLGRLFESILGDHHSSLLIRIYNFRGPPARWPVAMLSEGGDWVAHAHSQNTSRPPACRQLAFRYIRKVCCDFRRWIRNSSSQAVKSEFTFPQPPRFLSKAESRAYRTILEIVRRREVTHRPKSNTALSRYLREAVYILELEARRARAPKVTFIARQVKRLVKDARNSLGIAHAKTNPFAGGQLALRELELNLVPMRFLEALVFSNLPAVSDLSRSTAHVILLIDIYTGRRIADFADTILGDIIEYFNLLDLTITSTKVQSMRMGKLPLHRLFPLPAMAYIRNWLRALVAADCYRADITIFELITSNKRILRTSKEVTAQELDRSLVKALDGDMTRMHLFRYTFATWAPIAAMLSWHQNLRTHPIIAPWVRDSYFFSDTQMTQWQALSVSPTADPFTTVSWILGHTNTDELQRDYFMAWHLMAQLTAILAADAL